MRVLLVGGAGYVGRLVLPRLSRHHQPLVFDLTPFEGYRQRLGDATDPEALAGAMAGVDAVIHCAMGVHIGQDPATAAASFDVNVKSVYLTLEAAHQAQVPHAIYMSSLSVHRDIAARHLDETIPPDETELYGLTKRFGEQVCAAASAQWGLSVNILRLALPTPDDAWPLWAPPWRDEPGLFTSAHGVGINACAASDLANAVLAALEYRNGCEAFIVSGDTSGQWSTAKARRLLGWTPRTT